MNFTESEKIFKEEYSYKCAKCGCLEIQRKEWVEINTGKVVDPCEEDADIVWCPNCEMEVKMLNK